MSDDSRWKPPRKKSGKKPAPMTRPGSDLPPRPGTACCVRVSAFMIIVDCEDASNHQAEHDFGV